MPVTCHIAGINSKMKEELIKYIEELSDVTFLDLDKLTLDIRNDKETGELYKRQGNKLIQKNWKKQMDDNISQFVNNNEDKRVVLIGMSTFNRNHRIKADIPNKNKFFVDVDYRDNIRNIIKYNIDHYSEKIIDGTFPLNFLDYDYLTKQRDKLSNIYMNMGYKAKNIDDIKDWISGNRELVYVGRRGKHDSTIPINKKSIIGDSKIIVGYPNKWLAVLSTVPNVKQSVEKGLIQKDGKTIPYVKEKYQDAFNNLHMPSYIYGVNKDQFHSTVRYKRKSSKAVKFISREEIADVYDYLELDGVKMINCD